MATETHTTTTTATDVAPPALFTKAPSSPTKAPPPSRLASANGHAPGLSPPAIATTPPSPKIQHVAAVHSRLRTSCLSHDSGSTPSFLGFRNLMVLVLIVSNLRLMVENFIKYGVLICLRCHDYRRQDVVLGAFLFLLIPCHLFGAYMIEVAAAAQAKRTIGRRKKDDVSDLAAVQRPEERRKARSTWRMIGLAHAINATLGLCITSAVVYWFIHHPLIGTACELHAIIVWLKTCSYAFSNRDLRLALLFPATATQLPAIYAACPYPQNITIQNLSYFWWAPTLVYQPVYPRTDRIRLGFVAKRLAETAVLSMFIWILSAQYAAPVLRNSLDKMQTLNVASIIERLMKLSTISLIIWLAGFFAVFQSLLNGLAELMMFGDREFYTDWWNSPSVGTYWRTWNKPVYQFMRRHVYTPLIGRGCNPNVASAIVFIFSGFLHELLVGIPTHNILGVAFVGMVIQIPMIAITLPLEKMKGTNGKIIGNAIFWISFCLVGQPLAALLYFFAWQAKYGSVSKALMR